MCRVYVALLIRFQVRQRIFHRSRNCVVYQVPQQAALLHAWIGRNAGIETWEIYREIEGRHISDVLCVCTQMIEVGRRIAISAITSILPLTRMTGIIETAVWTASP